LKAANYNRNEMPFTNKPNCIEFLSNDFV